MTISIVLSDFLPALRSAREQANTVTPLTDWAGFVLSFPGQKLIPILYYGFVHGLVRPSLD